MVTKQAEQKTVSMEGNEQVLDNMCTAVPVLEGTVLFVPSCGLWYTIPSRTTCDPTIPGTYPWYVHPKKKKYEEGRKPRKVSEIEIKEMYKCPPRPHGAGATMKQLLYYHECVGPCVTCAIHCFDHFSINSTWYYLI